LECVARTAAEIAGVAVALDSAAAPPAERFEGAVQAETLYPTFNFGWRALRAREEAGWKLVTGARDRLYRTATDPGETNDVAAAHPDIVASMKSALADAWAEARGRRPSGGARATTPDEVEALRTLGYLGGRPPDAARLEEAFEVGADPEDRISLVTRINLALTSLDSGRSAAAESLLAGVVREDPENRLALEFLGRARSQRGEWRAAREAFRRALASGPNPVSVHLELGRVERELGDEEAEQRALEEALRVDPRSVAARLDLARVLMRRGRPKDAAALLEEALRILPRSVAAHVGLAEAYDADGRTADAVPHWQRAAELDPDGALGDAARAALARARAGGRAP
jgi:Tfp pilus assembly protein PilF